MSENRTMLCDTADKLFADLADCSFEAGWARVKEAGFVSLLVPQAGGGFGGDYGDLTAVMRLAGSHAVALPIGETIVAASILHQVAMDHDGRALGLAPRASGNISGASFGGTLHHVPWGRHAAALLARLGDVSFIVETSAATIVESASPAGEPRDSLSFSRVPIRVVRTGPDPFALGALLRVAQTAGALDRALAMSIDHANQRQQFGKPLAKFQAVQQNLAIFAVEAAATNCAAAAAAAALDRGDALFEIAAAKLRANLAIEKGTAIAHQVHGAIGFTHEYPLHRLTRRMMGWRSEFGNDRYWAELLGGIAASCGGAGLWAEITRRSDPMTGTIHD